MTRTIEITAKTESEARSIADGELNDNEIIGNSEILVAPARGIFGFVGKQEFKIRFTICEKQEEKTIDSMQETIRPREASAGDNYSEDLHNDSLTPKRTHEKSYDDRNSRHPRGNSRNNDRSRPSREPRRYENEDEAIDLPERPKAEVSARIKSHHSYNMIFELINDVSKNVGIDAIEMTDFLRDGAWVIEVSGENVSQLIGKRGKNLDALQYLMNIIFNKGQDDRVKLVLDVQGYREKRYRNLMILANRMCRKALSTRKQIELEPMSTLDRRTVHLALKDRTDVETYSKGAEPMRKVVISPVRKKKTAQNADWQPLKEHSDSDFSDRIESSTSVPMFMEEDV